jgi:hypothetical protein
MVCQLFTPLGTSVGYLGYMNPGNLNDYFNPYYSSGGFPQQRLGGNYLGVQDGISVISYSIYPVTLVVLFSRTWSSARKTAELVARFGMQILSR